MDYDIEKGTFRCTDYETRLETAMAKV
jgi:hypothetical protein